MNRVEDDGRILGFRPESFLPTTTFAATDQILRIELTVQRVEYLGCDRLLYGITGAPLQTTRVIARLPASMSLSPEIGSPMAFAVREEDLSYFDKASGESIAPPAHEIGRGTCRERWCRYG